MGLLRKRLESRFIIVIAVLGLTAVGLSQNQQPKIQLSAIDETVQKNWLGVPQSVVYNVEWDVTSGSALTFDRYRLFIWTTEERGNAGFRDSVTLSSRSYRFSSLPVGKRYHFRVAGLRGESVSAVSDTAVVVTGRTLRAKGPDSEENRSVWTHGWIFNIWTPLDFVVNGRTFLALCFNAHIFDNSTFLGKLCFHLIWWSMWIGILILLVPCRKNLTLNRVFPEFRKKRGNHSGRFQEDVISVWKRIIADERNKRISPKETESKLHGLVDQIERHYTDYPTARVFKTGVESHLIEKEFNNEVERDFEMRVEFETEQIVQNSRYEWLNFIAQICPLLGLFGTVTGISQAFMVISSNVGSLSQEELMQKLSFGIFEALWTTIEGLLFGMAFLFIHRFFERRIEWIHARWVEQYGELMSAFK